jgi:sulfite exporter TauE/SafE
MHIETSFAAFMAGLGTGAHCALMCGPLACAVRVRPLEYHGSRMAAYVLFGGVFGGIGEWLLGALQKGPVRFAPWVLLAAFVLMALGWERRLPVSVFVGRLGARVRLDRSLGWLTPLLPCGPLWLMLGAAAASGSAVGGGLLLFWFSLGTVVLYVAIQGGLLKLLQKASPQRLGRVQRGLLWFATGLLAWRLWNGGVHGCCSL